MVSTTRWASAPALKPGPRAMINGAWCIWVPVFFLARIASTRTWGFREKERLSSGSISRGMRREAHCRQSLWFKRRWADEYFYAILRPEWLKHREQQRQRQMAAGREAESAGGSTLRDSVILTAPGRAGERSGRASGSPRRRPRPGPDRPPGLGRMASISWPLRGLVARRPVCRTTSLDLGPAASYHRPRPPRKSPPSLTF